MSATLPLAIIGTTTGTVSFVYSIARDLLGRKQRLEVRRHWHYYQAPDGSLSEVFIDVSAVNTGRRSLHIEYAGFETRIAAEPGDAGYEQVLFEIALNTEKLAVEPDGPSVAIWTRLVPLAQHGVRALSTPIRPFVVTAPNRYWFGEWQTPIEHVTEWPTLDELDAYMGRRLVEATSDPDFGLPLGDPKRSGRTVGLIRVVPEGDVERLSDLVAPRHDGSEARLR